MGRYKIHPSLLHSLLVQSASCGRRMQKGERHHLARERRQHLRVVILMRMYVMPEHFRICGSGQHGLWELQLKEYCPKQSQGPEKLRQVAQSPHNIKGLIGPERAKGQGPKYIHPENLS